MGGGEEGALKNSAGLPSCAPRPVTKHRIHHFVYFSQLSAYKKGLGATRLSGHSLAALDYWNSQIKHDPAPRSACQKVSSALPLPPSAPHPCLLLQRGLTKNKTGQRWSITATRVVSLDQSGRGAASTAVHNSRVRTFAHSLTYELNQKEENESENQRRERGVIEISLRFQCSSGYRWPVIFSDLSYLWKEVDFFSPPSV